MRVDEATARRSPANFTEVESVTLVLVVEPDAVLRDQIGNALRRDGNEVLELNDGAALLEYFQVTAYGPSVTPDVIVAGVSRPEAQVLDACERVQELGQRVPVVLLSKRRELILDDVYERAGVAFFFHRPLDLSRVRAAVSSLAWRS